MEKQLFVLVPNSDQLFDLSRKQGWAPKAEHGRVHVDLAHAPVVGYINLNLNEATIPHDFLR